MARGHGRLDAQHGDGQVLIAAQADMALSEVRVQMAKATARDVDHHLSRLRQRNRKGAKRQRSAESDDLKCSHRLNPCWMRDAHREGGARPSSVNHATTRCRRVTFPAGTALCGRSV